MPSDIKDKDTIITLTSTTSDNAPNFEHSKFGVGVIEGGGKDLKQGDRINLIYDKNKHMIVPTDTTKHYTLMQGVSKEYTFSIETQDKEYIYAKIDTAPVIPGTDDNPTTGDTPNNPDTGNTGGTGETEKPTEKPNPTNPSTGDNTGTPSAPGDTGNTGETGNTGADTSGTTPTPINPNPNTPVSGSNNTPSNPSTGDNTGGSGTNPINPNPGSTNPTTPAYNTKFTKDKSFLEAGLGGAGAINAGADMVSSDGIKSMKASAIAARGDMGSFAIAGASKLKYKTGSYVDTKGKMR